MRVVIAEDEVLLREGLARLLTDAGFEVVGKAGDARRAAAPVDARRPTRADRHPDAADAHRRGPRRRTGDRPPAPGTGVLVLSHYLESSYALRLLRTSPSGPATCSRTAFPTSPSSPMRCAASGRASAWSTRRSSSRLLARHRSGPLADLTAREREILALMAEGHSNDGICRLLFLSPKTVEGHIHQIFLKLDLTVSADQHRRVSPRSTFLRA